MLQWFKFWLLAAIWGASFLLIKIAVVEMGALSLVSVRLGGAALLFLVFLLATGRRLPDNRRQLLALVFIGIFNTAVPFFLISWGEETIDSGLATVLNATVPLFGLIIAHYTLGDERLGLGKIIGLAVGFLGVVLLVSQSLGDISANPLAGQLAVLAASASYAVCIVSVRVFFRHEDPFMVAGYSTIIGAVVIVLATLLLADIPSPGDLSTNAIAAGVTLAVVNTFVAYFLFFDLIDKWGARATLVTYAMPPIGVTLGFLVLDESIGWRLIVGGTMIIGGIVLAKNASTPAAEKPLPVPEAVAAPPAGD